jgi:hypothetical protein
MSPEVGFGSDPWKTGSLCWLSLSLGDDHLRGTSALNYELAMYAGELPGPLISDLWGIWGDSILKLLSLQPSLFCCVSQ